MSKLCNTICLDKPTTATEGIVKKTGKQRFMFRCFYS